VTYEVFSFAPLFFFAEKRKAVLIKNPNEKEQEKQ